MDVDAEEFLASLSVAQRATYIRKKTNNIHRSWILFLVRSMDSWIISLKKKKRGLIFSRR